MNMKQLDPRGRQIGITANWGAGIYMKQIIFAALQGRSVALPPVIWIRNHFRFWMRLLKQSLIRNWGSGLGLIC
jgi:hypothetical protein